MSVTPVILPKLGLTMDEGRFVAWLKKEGDHVEAGEVLFEVETDKATMEVESPVAGFVRRLLAAAGDEIPVTAVIALISTTADEPIADEPAAVSGPRADARRRADARPGLRVPAGTPDERVVASPAARKRAAGARRGPGPGPRGAGRQDLGRGRRGRRRGGRCDCRSAAGRRTGRAAGPPGPSANRSPGCAA